MAAETVAGIFPDRAAAERALALLHARGFGAEVVGVLAAGGEEPATGDAPATGAAVGGLMGGLGGLLLTAGLFVIPGIGPVLAAGHLLTVLGGAAVGAGAGELLAVLRKAGIQDDQARRLETHLQQGHVLVMVHQTLRHEEARALLREAGASETDFSLAGDEPAGDAALAAAVPAETPLAAPEDVPES